MSTTHYMRLYSRRLFVGPASPIGVVAALACATCLPGPLFGQGAWTGNSTVTYTPPGSTKVAIGTQVPFLNFQVQGDPASAYPVATLLSNHDFVFGSTGSALYSGLGAASGNTYSELQAFINGILVGGSFIPGSLILNRNGGNVGIGTANPNPAHLLSVAGAIGAREVVVSASEGADYVFEPDYRLRPLSEVAAYVKENHHLPEIPSAAEMTKSGISVGDMQVKLLAKVEELTLHMIEADEKNSRLEQQNRELRDRIARLEGREGKE